MKMHLKKVHSTSNLKQSGRKKQTLSMKDLNGQTEMFECDNCGYKTQDRKVLRQHIDAILFFNFRAARQPRLY